MQYSHCNKQLPTATINIIRERFIYIILSSATAGDRNDRLLVYLLVDSARRWDGYSLYNTISQGRPKSSSFAGGLEAFLILLLLLLFGCWWAILTDPLLPVPIKVYNLRVLQRATIHWIIENRFLISGNNLFYYNIIWSYIFIIILVMLSIDQWCLL